MRIYLHYIIRTNKEMNYLEHTTILLKNTTEYKLIRTQQYNNISQKASNNYYINGKQVRCHERSICEQAINEATFQSLESFERKWVK